MKSLSLSIKSILGSTIISMGLWSVISMSAYTANLAINTETVSEEIAMVTIHDYTAELQDLSSELVVDGDTADELYMAFRSSNLNNINTASGSLR